MLSLILILIVGSGLVYISRFNYTPVDVNLGVYAFTGVPLFYVIVAAILIGLTISYIVLIINSISYALTVRKKDIQLKKDQEEILELTKRVHQLELDGEKLKNGDITPVPSDPNAL
jgi:hypothetical protein